MLEEYLTVQEGGGFRAVKCRCAGRGDTVHEDPVEGKKVRWADLGGLRLLRAIKRMIILIRTVCCGEAHTCNP